MLKTGFEQARDITRRHAHTFYLTSFFLPKEKRLAAYAVYALCRLGDESVDNTQASDEQKKKDLAIIQEKISHAFSAVEITDPLIFCFRKTVHKYRIPKEYFDELISGMAMDLTVSRYQTFNELYDYSYKVAGVIGLIMTKIFGYKNTDAEKHAIELGIALQLTNILRDIKEDFARGRIYLPQTEMKKFEITEDDLGKGLVNERFKSFMRFQIERARDYFCRASQGLPLITDKRCRFTAFLILEFYAKILTKIEKNNFDVYSKRAIVPWHEKFFGLFPLTFHFFSNSFTFHA